MSNKIEEIKRVLKSGSKASKYLIKFVFPPEVSASMDLKDMSCLAKATTFPGVTIGQIEVYNQGRKLVIPGDTAYENTWNVTFYNDAAHKIRKSFLAWMNAADNFQANTHSGNPGGLFVEMSVSQLDSLEKEVVTYTFRNVWPSGVAEVSVGADQLDTLQEFDVTLSFSDWIVESGEFSDFSVKNASENVVAPNQ